MEFAQAQIAVENGPVFRELKSVIENALSERNVEAFLHTLKRFSFKVRQFEKVLAGHVFEQLPGAAASKPAEELYTGLSPSDQGMIREFYLTAIERVPMELRQKYQKLYQYS